MTASTFGMSGSVMRRNLVPVYVWKQVRRKKEVSSVSRPVTGRWGLGVVVWIWEEEEGLMLSGDGAMLEALGLLLGRLKEVGFLVGIRGVRDFVMACTPWKVPARTR